MDGICGATSEHGAAVERKDADAFERPQSGTKKQVDRQEIGTARLRIIPHGELRVIA